MFTQLLNLPPVVGFCGWPGVGKDTAATILSKLGYTHRSFAAGLKRLALKLNPTFEVWHNDNGEIIPNTSYSGMVLRTRSLQEIVNQIGPESAKSYLKVREYYQALGHGVREEVSEYAGLYPMQFPKDQYKAISDVRYPNEGSFVTTFHYVPGSAGPIDNPVFSKAKFESGLLIWLNREGCGPPNDHPSALGECREIADHEIDNNGEVWELEVKLYELLKVTYKVNCHKGVFSVTPEVRH